MAAKNETKVSYTKAPKKAKIKEGGSLLLSEALHKKSSSNLTPKSHLKRGDTVMLMNGPKKEDKKRSSEDTARLNERNAYKGTIGKVAAVFPKEGKVLIEGVNMMSHFVKNKGMGGESGIIRKAVPVFASRVMLYDSNNKRPVRGDKRKALGL